ncbi:MAG: cytochrome c [Methylibium sp.]|uniref:c-type cytochrome n=1 Tax=Methylibium sp. TaxID=2067992 RepID=UPI0017EFB3BB|nr:cytochrome c [Methylibium sp.]MBA2722301.1 cytochrome c [Methylibium sp.]MBA3589396.1 cytochrome c [Methylibium sp.]
MKFHRLASSMSFALACALPGSPAAAQTSTEIFDGADLALGERLIEEHRCAQCHTKTVGGDGSAIYRPKGRINTPGFLRGMVEQCNTQMNLGMFPEEVTAIAAVLNRDHYRFKQPD